MPNEAIKMSKVFKLPLELDTNYECIYDQSGEDNCVVAEIEHCSFKQAEAIVHAVNNHDTLTAKLEEAVELLNKTTGQLHKLKDFIVSPLEIDMVCKTVKRNDDFLQAIKQIKE